MSQQIIPVAEWLEEGKKLFGPDWMRWQFECPVCHHVQTPADFKAMNDEPQSAYQMCIGRLLPKEQRSPTGPGVKSPCDYAAFGLFRLGILVQGEGPTPTCTFPFYRPANVATQSEASHVPEGAI